MWQPWCGTRPIKVMREKAFKPKECLKHDWRERKKGVSYTKYYRSIFAIHLEWWQINLYDHQRNIRIGVLNLCITVCRIGGPVYRLHAISGLYLILSRRDYYRQWVLAQPANKRSIGNTYPLMGPGTTLPRWVVQWTPCQDIAFTPHLRIWPWNERISRNSQ